MAVILSNVDGFLRGPELNETMYLSHFLTSSYFKVNENHWLVFAGFFEAHPDLITGRVASINGREENRKLWQELAQQLNAVGMGERTVEKWQKTWADFKSNLKKKAAEINRLRAQTGGGPPTEKILSDLEQRLLSLLGESFYAGCKTKELGVQNLGISINEGPQSSNGSVPPKTKD
ncbi:hypothetical protein FQR65_LT05694 [Abscondita terminalis]|nr:hypothetical protein FQR65_LT05694 [Abscondita terminalis]